MRRSASVRARLHGDDGAIPSQVAVHGHLRAAHPRGTTDRHGERRGPAVEVDAPFELAERAVEDEIPVVATAPAAARRQLGDHPHERIGATSRASRRGSTPSASAILCTYRRGIGRFPSTQRETLLSQYNQLLQTKTQLQLNNQLQVNSQIVQQASSPTQLSLPRSSLYVVIGFVAGAFVGAVIAVLLARVGSRAVNADQVGEELGFAVVGRMPKLNNLKNDKRHAL